MAKRRCTGYSYAFMLFILGVAVCISPDVYAGGVHFGVGVDVPLPGPAMAPPVFVAPPPVVVERVAPPVVVRRTPPPVVVERMPPPVVYQQSPRVYVRRTPPPIVAEGPVVVEQRSTVTTYYPPAYQSRTYTYREETGREYYNQSSRSWEETDEY